MRLTALGFRASCLSLVLLLIAGCSREPAAKNKEGLQLRAPGVFICGPSGEPVEGARVTWHPVLRATEGPRAKAGGRRGIAMISGREAAWSETSDERGYVEGPLLPHGEYQLRARLGEWAGVFPTGIRLGAKGARYANGSVGRLLPPDLRFSIRRFRDLTIRVRTEGAQPGVGVPVLLSRAGQLPREEFNFRSGGFDLVIGAMTDSRGELRWRITDAGGNFLTNHRLRVSAMVFGPEKGQAVGQIAKSLDEDELIELIIPPVVSVTMKLPEGVDTEEPIHLTWKARSFKLPRPQRFGPEGGLRKFSRRGGLAYRMPTDPILIPGAWACTLPPGGGTLGCFLPGAKIAVHAEVRGYSKPLRSQSVEIPTLSGGSIELEVGEQQAKIIFNVTDRDGERLCFLGPCAYINEFSAEHTPFREDDHFALYVDAKAAGRLRFALPIGRKFPKSMFEHWPVLDPGETYDLGELPSRHLIPRARGRVVDELGRPLDGASIQIWSHWSDVGSFPRQNAQSHPDGSFLMRGEPLSGGTYYLQARHGERISDVVEAKVGDNELAEAMIVAKPAGRIAGRLALKEGFADFVKVSLRRMNERYSREIYTSVSAAGSFSTWSLLPDKYRVRIRFGGLELLPDAVFEVRSGETTMLPLDAVNAQLSEFEAVVIKVLGSDGKPMKRAKLHPVGNGMKTLPSYSPASTSNDFGEAWTVFHRDTHPRIVVIPPWGGRFAHIKPVFASTLLQGPPFPSQVKLRRNHSIAVEIVPPLPKVRSLGWELRLVPAGTWSKELEQGMKAASGGYLRVSQLTGRELNRGRLPRKLWGPSEGRFRIQAYPSGLSQSWLRASILEVGEIDTSKPGVHRIELTKEQQAQVQAMAEGR